jgi:hypothetical protein
MLFDGDGYPTNSTLGNLQEHKAHDLPMELPQLVDVLVALRTWG